MAFTGFAVDLGSWTARAAEIQATSDAASLSGVTYMPNVSQARQEARRVAAMNGFTHGVDGVTVDVQEIGNAQLEVTITDGDVEQFFTSLFTNTVTIKRSAVAEYIKPVPMGSPRNYLGTNQLLSGQARENFWLAVQGYCSRREHGDRITPFTDSNGGPSDSATDFQGCDPDPDPPNPIDPDAWVWDGTSEVIPNAEWRDWGYVYAIELDDGDDVGGETWPYNPRVDMYDATHCMSGDPASRSPSDTGAESGAARQYLFTLRSNDSLDPLSTTVIQQTTVGPANCDYYDGYWRSFGTLRTAAGGNATEGIYYMQIQPIVPSDKTEQEGNNLMAMRAIDPGAGTWHCTSDATTASADVSLRTDCPKVYGLTHLGVYANVSDDPSFYLASVQPHHAGREMTVELWDTAEGAEGIEILDPSGNPVSFTWEIACQDGTYQSEEGACTTNERAPYGGYGPTTASYLDVSGSWGATATTPQCRYRPWACRTGQPGKYSDRLIRLRFDLPTLAVNPTWYGGNTWFKIRYSVSASVGDRTTWSVSIAGDPVRLIE